MKFCAIGTYRNNRIFSSALAFIITNGDVLYGSRHSLRDRLRAVECPPDIIDDMGGPDTTGICHACGDGQGMNIIAKWMRKIEG